MGSKPFSAKALEPIPPLQTSMRMQVIERSRKNYARPRAEVEESVREFFGYNKNKDGAKTISSTNVSANPQRPASDTRPPHRQEGQTPKGTQAPKGVYKKPDTPAKPPASKNSESLNDLLGKLDTAIVKVEAPKPNPKPEPTVTPNPIELDTVAPLVAPVSIPKPTTSDLPATQPKITPTPPPAPRKFVQDLSRAASPEKKNALQEALARAMAGNKTPVPIESISQIPQPPVTPPQEEPIKIPEPPQPEPAPIPTYSQSKTVREVPEDILRRALE